MANKQKLSIETVIQQLDEEDDIDWGNSEDEEEWDDEIALEEADYLDLAQITDAAEEEYSEVIGIDTNIPTTHHMPIPNSIPPLPSLAPTISTRAHTSPISTTPSTPTNPIIAPNIPTTTPTIPRLAPTISTTTPSSPTHTAPTTTATTVNNVPFSPPPFTENIGPSVSLDSDATALDAFLLIFGSDTFQLLADQTNLYAKQSPPGASYKWYDTNEDEMKLFFGMLLIMGIHRLPQLEDYRSSNPLLGTKGIVAGMSWCRFWVLLSCLHLADNSKEVPRGQPGFDKLYKVRPLIDILLENIKACYYPHREVAIDEAMVGFKGRSTLKQYMPMKPTKCGFKVWCLCDSANGFTY